MPKEPKSPGKHVYVKFTEPEDIRLLSVLENNAKSERRELGLYILLQLHTQFEASIPSNNNNTSSKKYSEKD